MPPLLAPEAEAVPPHAHGLLLLRGLLKHLPAERHALFARSLPPAVPPQLKLVSPQMLPAVPPQL
jgi:hypothetical protein